MSSPTQHLISRCPGAFKDLSYGRVHYILKKPEGESKGLCVCIHGFSTEGTIFLPMMDMLVEAGYSAIALDLYGRGFSDAAPDEIPNNMSLFLSCISELLFSVAEETDKLSVSNLILIGYSMGGAIVAEFAQRHTSIVKKLIMLAPAGLPLPVPFTAKLVQSPIVGTALFHMAARKTLARHIDRSYFDPRAPEIREARQLSHRRMNDLFTHHHGYSRSLLSTLRYFPFGELEETFHVLGSTTLPVLLVWGNKDVIVPFSNLSRMQELMPHAQVCVIENSGHGDIVAHPDHVAQVFNSIQTFLDSPEN
eukprot:m.175002 g.175002  ORF g.175002 m.175002 type:complete len:307 (+) comp16544_c0_seq6:212-1132(+)